MKRGGDLAGRLGAPFGRLAVHIGRLNSLPDRLSAEAVVARTNKARAFTLFP